MFIHPIERRYRSLRMAVLCTVLAMLMAGGFSPAAMAASAGDAVPRSTPESEHESELRQLVNAYRERNRLEALAFDAHLFDLAREHSRNMNSAGVISHDGFADRAQRSGYGTCIENVGMGYRTAEALFQGWKSSSGHNKNMLDDNIDQVGISRIGNYITFLACGR